VKGKQRNAWRDNNKKQSGLCESQLTSCRTTDITGEQQVQPILGLCKDGKGKVRHTNHIN